MARISRQNMFMQVAHVAAQRSTCMRLNVGAVLVTAADHRVLSIGYNGPPAGEEHCSGADCCDASKGCQRALHAEVNAIERVSPFDITKTMHLYCTDSPCAACFDRILRLGTITAIFYDRLYRRAEHFAVDHPLAVYRVTPNGMLINHRSGELVDA